MTTALLISRQASQQIESTKVREWLVHAPKQRRGLWGLYGADRICLTNAAAGTVREDESQFSSVCTMCVYSVWSKKEKKEERKGVCLPIPFENGSAFGEGVVAISEGENMFSRGSEGYVSRL